MLFQFNESPIVMGPGFGNSEDLGFKDCKSKISMRLVNKSFATSSFFCEVVAWQQLAKQQLKFKFLRAEERILRNYR